MVDVHRSGVYGDRCLPLYYCDRRVQGDGASARWRAGAVVTLAGPKGYITRPGHLVVRFVFFVSSGNDVAHQRDLLEGMLREASTQFRLREDGARPFVLEVDRWEQDVARRTKDMNEEFVRRARAAHATVVLLATEVRPGTRAEIEAVLDEDDVQLSVIWMEAPSSANKSRTLKKFLREHSDRIAYKRTGPPDSDDALMALVGVVAAALADITRGERREELFSEYR